MVSPDGTRIVVASRTRTTGELIVLDAVTEEEMMRVPVGADVRDVIAGGEPGLFLSANRRGSGISIVDLDPEG